MFNTHLAKACILIYKEFMQAKQEITGKRKQAKDLSRCVVKTGIIKWKKSTWRDTHCHYTPENDDQSNRYHKIPHTLPEQWKEKTVVMNYAASRTFTHPWGGGGGGQETCRISLENG